MFFAGSRYQGASQYLYPPNPPSGGKQVLVVNVYRTTSVAPRGAFPRKQGQRLDQIAGYYLSDPTTFWKLCDASGAVVPDALANSDLVDIP